MRYTPFQNIYSKKRESSRGTPNSFFKIIFRTKTVQCFISNNLNILLTFIEKSTLLKILRGHEITVSSSYAKMANKGSIWVRTNIYV